MRVEQHEDRVVGVSGRAREEYGRDHTVAFLGDEVLDVAEVALSLGDEPRNLGATLAVAHESSSMNWFRQPAAQK
jgi:hypothetical protein